MNTFLLCDTNSTAMKDHADGWKNSTFRPAGQRFCRDNNLRHLKDQGFVKNQNKNIEIVSIKLHMRRSAIRESVP